MDKLIIALAPVFAAGMGIQQLGELLDPVLERVSPNNKRVVMGLVSLSLGLVVAFQAKLHVLTTIGPGIVPDNSIIDPLITGLIISGGTEGINSILKFMKYTKEDKKNEAAAKAPAAPGVPAAPGAAVAPGVPAATGVPAGPTNGTAATLATRASAAAVQELNRK